MASRGYSWCFTVNNFTEDDEHCVFAAADEAAALVCGREVGENGTRHLQGFMRFASLKSLDQLKQLLPRAHLEQKSKHSTFRQAWDYCMKGAQEKAEWDEMKTLGPSFGKDADVFVKGECPPDPKDCGEREKRKWDGYLAAQMAGKLEEIPTDIRVRYGQGLARVALENKVLAANPNGLPTLPGDGPWHYWIYGPEGTGKTHRAIELCGAHPDAYWKDSDDPYWQQYEGQHNVVVDEYAAGGMSASQMKKLLDKNPFLCKVKFGGIFIRPRLVVVTSNYHPRECFKEKDLGPVMRRIILEHRTEPYVPRALVEPPPLENEDPLSDEITTESESSTLSASIWPPEPPTP